MRLTHRYMCYLSAARADVTVKVEFNSIVITQNGKLNTSGWRGEVVQVMYPLPMVDIEEIQKHMNILAPFDAWLRHGHGLGLCIDADMSMVEIRKIEAREKETYSQLVEVFGGLVI